MERVAEPELMETKEQVISYSEADFSEGEDNLINQIDYYLLKNNISLGEKDLIVDLGCGPGNISEKLSIRWPNTEVVGVDGSKEMIIKAESNKNISNYRKQLKNLEQERDQLRLFSTSGPKTGLRTQQQKIKIAKPKRVKRRVEEGQIDPKMQIPEQYRGPKYGKPKK